MKKIVLPIVGVVAIVLVALYFVFFNTTTENNNQTNETGGTVAVVNGEEISRNYFESVKSQVLAQQGVDLESVDDNMEKQINEQIVDQIISQTLIEQAVADSGITAPEEEVDAQLDATISQLGGDEAFEQVLSSQGLDRDFFLEQIRSNINTQAYIEQELDTSSITVTDEEVEAAYNEISSQNENIPALEEVRAQIEQSVRQQKQQSLTLELIERLRAEADIEINL